MKNSFGLASIKKEGGHLWPSDYLIMNGKYPSVELYTLKELQEIIKAGFGGSDWFKDESK